MADINNPHDKFFKGWMSDINRARELLQELLPLKLVKQIKFETLVHKKGSFVTGALKEFISDVIFKVELYHGSNIYISVLLEHKSYKDKHIHFQLLAYLGNAYIDQIKNKEPLTLILPVVYYHGKETWELVGIEHLFKDYPDSMLKYLPKFDLELIDLTRLSENEIINLASDMLITPLLLQKYSHNQTALSKRIIQIFSSLSPYLNVTHLNAIFVYTYQLIELEKEELEIILKQLPKPAKNSFMTTYEKLLKEGEQIGLRKGKVEGEQIGLRKGKVEGEQIGLRKGKAKSVKNCFKEGVSQQLASKISGLSLEEVSKIYSEMTKKD